MTGFRVAFGGAQALLRHQARPDLPRQDRRRRPARRRLRRQARDHERASRPLGPVYQAGTLSGNPLAVAAGQKMLELLAAPRHLRAARAHLGARSSTAWARSPARRGVALTTNRVGSMFTGFFTDGPVTDYATAKKSDTARFGKFFHAMLDGGVYLAPSQFEAAFVSLAHDARAIDRTLEAARQAM